MHTIHDYERYVIDYIENSGFSPDEWDVEGAALELEYRLDGESPDDMDEDEFVDIIKKSAI